MNTVNPWGVRLTDKELMSAIITCVMNGKQADRDDACRLLQGHIRAVEHQASGSYALGREDGLREAAHICQDLMTNGVRGYERATLLGTRHTNVPPISTTTPTQIQVTSGNT